MLIFENSKMYKLFYLFCLMIGSISMINCYTNQYQSSISISISSSSSSSFRKLYMIDNKVSNSNNNNNRLIKKRDIRQSDDISTIDIGRTGKKINNIKTISVKKRKSDDNDNDNDDILTKQSGIFIYLFIY